MAVLIPDEKTSKLQLPLPNPLRNADIDCLRIAQAFQLIDDWAAQGGGIAEFDSYAEFPGVGEEKKIYMALDTGRFYRWDDEDNAYVSVGAPGSTDDVPEGTAHLYFTAARARAAQLRATASDLGLMRVGSGLVVNAEGVVSVVGGSGSAGLPSFNELVLVPQTNGQTEFTITGGYTAGVIELFFNGVLIYGNGDDYTATDGSKIVLTVGANTSDRLLLRRWTTASNLPFAALVDVPNTLAGHGIADGVKASDFTFAKLGGKPTTAAGYGITDVALSSDVWLRAPQVYDKTKLMGDLQVGYALLTSTTGRGGDWPAEGTDSAIQGWLVETTGMQARAKQVASQLLFSEAGQIKGSTFTRVLHDTTWSPWDRVITARTMMNTAVVVNVPAGTPSYSLDPSLGSMHIVTVNGTVTFNLPANPRQLGDSVTLHVISAGAIRPIVFSSNVVLPKDSTGATLPFQQYPADGMATLLFQCLKPGLWQCYYGGVH